MRYIALACDYDGTLAHDGRVADETVEALKKLRASGRRLLLVTGRELDDLMRVFESVDLFDRIVAENGGIVYEPASGELEVLAPRPPDELVDALKRRGVTPLSVGHVIVATWQPHDATVLEIIRDAGLELQVIFNKGAVMVLPSGVNKASGLLHALRGLKLSPHNVVGVGDAENDHAFLSASECGVAVANALESLKARADLVTSAEHGAGVVELIDRVLATDLSDVVTAVERHRLVIGRALDDSDVALPPHLGGVLIAGPSGAGKTTVTTALLERLCEGDYQFCVVDPEGDYHEVPEAVALRGEHDRSLADDVMQVLDQPDGSVVASLFDMRLDERPQFFQRLLPRLLELRASTARPHWIVVDEAHHLLPAGWQLSDSMLPSQLANLVLVTVHPEHVATTVLQLVDTVIVVGRQPQATLDAFNRALGRSTITLPARQEDRVSWLVHRDRSPIPFRVTEPKVERRRHQRKYAEGELGEDISFYFRGPERRLNLRAQNLDTFVQMADGVDEDTWQFHLRQHDVSRWFREVIKDESLASEAAEIESSDLPAAESRARIRTAIESRYTKPA